MICNFADIVVSAAVEKLISLKREETASDIESILTTLLDLFNQSIIAFYEKTDTDFVEKLNL